MPRTSSDRRITTSRPAKPTAAIVATAYSAVTDPSSERRSRGEKRCMGILPSIGPPLWAAADFARAAEADSWTTAAQCAPGRDAGEAPHTGCTPWTSVGGPTYPRFHDRAGDHAAGHPGGRRH